PGKDLPGVISYRDLDDTNAMVEAAAKGGHAVVIGGGLLGLEAAAGLKARGMNVTVVHLMGHLMERQLDEAAGYLLKKSLEDKGIEIKLQASTKAILGESRAEAVLLESGETIAADLVVMAVGIRPETRLATDAHLEVERGIVVSPEMRTSDPNVLALGECVEFDGQLFGLVAPLYDQAKVAAATLMAEAAAYVPREVSTKLKVTGVDLFSAGDFAEGEGREDIVFRDPGRGIYKRLVLEGERLVGAVLYGDTADGGHFFNLIKEGASVSDERETLIFGPAFAGGAQADPLAAVAALPDDAEICGCNGVCKSTIVEAVKGGATTLGAVRAETKASSSCGTCTGLVEQVMALTLGDDYEAGAEAPVCGCTDHTHDELRGLIRAKGLHSQPAVWQELGWKTPNGCHVCRPAVNYYLLSTWPVEYQDDPQSRYVNERNHANIQMDGTYSVVPRMFGGLTTPEELRAIADVAERYEVPTVKVTGGQRIDLLGIQKEDLPDVWRDLNAAGMVSGHAYAKGLRTVKTCVGTEHCHVATQDSMGLGVKLEKQLWGTWTPHKLKVAVSGCPRNCAEATCKDFGVICVDAGYEIGVAGAAGMDLKETEPLAKVTTEAEVLEYAGAFIQLYREGARYLDRPYKWTARVGMDWVRDQLADPAIRKAALERFELSQSIYQKDPWAELASREEERFDPMANLMMEAAE
ncbi:MAG TPA: NAD(P)/FAD-dependent oxidoreductase, partial [Rhodobacterales bacterium]|nr:NAD(P)/FAD-dependent oxidoreductase [Rhodobacterales bacterium]